MAAPQTTFATAPPPGEVWGATDRARYSDEVIEAKKGVLFLPESTSVEVVYLALGIVVVALLVFAACCCCFQEGKTQKKREQLLKQWGKRRAEEQEEDEAEAEALEKEKKKKGDKDAQPGLMTDEPTDNVAEEMADVPLDENGEPMIEYRLDPEDNNLYDYDSFVEAYGDEDGDFRWRQSAATAQFYSLADLQRIH